jgi:hypothetical protein
VRFIDREARCEYIGIDLAGAQFGDETLSTTRDEKYAMQLQNCSARPSRAGSRSI